MRVLPLLETNAAFAVYEEGLTPERHVGMWVRMCNGVYKGDYAIVRNVIKNQDKVTRLVLAIVPRIGIKCYNATSDSKGALANRPERQVADPDKLELRFRKDRVERLSDREFIFRGMRFLDGLLQLEIDDLYSVRRVTPSLEDVFLFSHTPLGELDGVEVFLRVGDIVVVSSGATQGMAGVVSSFDKEICRLTSVCNLSCKMEPMVGRPLFCTVTRDQVRELQKISIHLPDLSVPRRDVRRIISQGDGVLIKAGPWKGSSALVASVCDTFVKLVVPPQSQDETVSTRLLRRVRKTHICT